jgi:hypothetical protein
MPHILEHCVLNGSKNFPVKSPFDVLARGFETEEEIKETVWDLVEGEYEHYDFGPKILPLVREEISKHLEKQKSWPMDPFPGKKKNQWPWAMRLLNA